MAAAIIRTVQTYHTIWEDDRQKFQSVSLFLSTVVEFLQILVCSEIAESHWSAYIHEIAIDNSYQVWKRRAEPSERISKKLKVSTIANRLK